MKMSIPVLRSIHCSNQSEDSCATSSSTQLEQCTETPKENPLSVGWFTRFKTLFKAFAIRNYVISDGDAPVRAFPLKFSNHVHDSNYRATYNQAVRHRRPLFIFILFILITVLTSGGIDKELTGGVGYVVASVHDPTCLSGLVYANDFKDSLDTIKFKSSSPCDGQHKYGDLELEGWHFMSNQLFAKELNRAWIAPLAMAVWFLSVIICGLLFNFSSRLMCCFIIILLLLRMYDYTSHPQQHVVFSASENFQSCYTTLNRADNYHECSRKDSIERSQTDYCVYSRQSFYHARGPVTNCSMCVILAVDTTSYSESIINFSSDAPAEWDFEDVFCRQRPAKITTDDVVKNIDLHSSKNIESPVSWSDLVKDEDIIEHARETGVKTDAVISRMFDNTDIYCEDYASDLFLFLVESMMFLLLISGIASINTSTAIWIYMYAILQQACLVLVNIIVFHPLFASWASTIQWVALNILVHSFFLSLVYYCAHMMDYESRVHFFVFDSRRVVDVVDGSMDELAHDLEVSQMRRALEHGRILWTRFIAACARCCRHEDRESSESDSDQLDDELDEQSSGDLDFASERAISHLRFETKKLTNHIEYLHGLVIRQVNESKLLQKKVIEQTFNSMREKANGCQEILQLTDGKLFAFEQLSSDEFLNELSLSYPEDSRRSVAGRHHLQRSHMKQGTNDVLHLETQLHAAAKSFYVTSSHPLFLHCEYNDDGAQYKPLTAIAWMVFGPLVLCPVSACLSRPKYTESPTSAERMLLCVVILKGADEQSNLPGQPEVDPSHSGFMSTVPQFAKKHHSQLKQGDHGTDLSENFIQDHPIIYEQRSCCKLIDGHTRCTRRLASMIADINRHYIHDNEFYSNSTRVAMSLFQYSKLLQSIQIQHYVHSSAELFTILMPAACHSIGFKNGYSTVNAKVETYEKLSDLYAGGPMNQMYNGFLTMRLLLKHMDSLLLEGIGTVVTWCAIKQQVIELCLSLDWERQLNVVQTLKERQMEPNLNVRKFRQNVMQYLLSISVHPHFFGPLDCHQMWAKKWVDEERHEQFGAMTLMSHERFNTFQQDHAPTRFLDRVLLPLCTTLDHIHASAFIDVIRQAREKNSHWESMSVCTVIDDTSLFTDSDLHEKVIESPSDYIAEVL